MDRADQERREQAWRAFHKWERSQPVPERPLGDLLAWLEEALRIARRAGALEEESPEEKATRIARLRHALAAIRPST